MLLCKIACQSDCKKKICCYECNEYETCDEACSHEGGNGRCEQAYEEENAIQLFNDEAMIIMKSIASLDKQKKAIDEQDKQIRNALKNAMDEFGIKSFENDLLKVTHIAETTKTSIDTAKLKKDYPDIAKKYSKVSKVSAYIRISVK